MTFRQRLETKYLEKGLLQGEVSSETAAQLSIAKNLLNSKLDLQFVLQQTGLQESDLEGLV